MKIDLNLREDIQKYFPSFDYKNCIEPERIDFSRPDNLVGVQQEAFLLYHILKQFFKNGEVGLDIGCGQDPHWGTVGINDYFGNRHPIYGGRYSPHITSLAENIDKIFNEKTFNFIVASHIIEHVKDPIITFRKWIKLLKIGGIIIVLCPDSTYEKIRWDQSHINFFTPNDFKEKLINTNLDLLRTEIFNNLGNMFSISYVGVRI